MFHIQQNLNGNYFDVTTNDVLCSWSWDHFQSYHDATTSISWDDIMPHSSGDIYERIQTGYKQHTMKHMNILIITWQAHVLHVGSKHVVWLVVSTPLKNIRQLG